MDASSNRRTWSSEGRMSVIGLANISQGRFNGDKMETPQASASQPVIRKYVYRIEKDEYHSTSSIIVLEL